MDPILYRPLDVLDEHIRRADAYQRNQPRRGSPEPAGRRDLWQPVMRHRG